MTAKQAYSLLTNKMTGVQVGKCHEYDSVFVFQLTPAMLRLSKNPSPMLDGLTSVNKRTGEVRDFKPFYIPIDEYRRGKELPDSAFKR